MEQNGVCLQCFTYLHSDYTIAKRRVELPRLQSRMLTAAFPTENLELSA